MVKGLRDTQDKHDVQDKYLVIHAFTRQPCQSVKS